MSAPRYEADDIIATLASVARDQNRLSVIIATDKDFMQLVHPDVALICPVKRKWIGVNEVIEKLGVPPELVPDLLGLAGDAVDNIPGVRGIGVKRASDLLQRFGGLEGIYDNLALLPKFGPKLAEDRELAFLGRELATLKADVSPNAMVPSFRDHSELTSLISTPTPLTYQSAIGYCKTNKFGSLARTIARIHETSASRGLLYGPPA
jgi:5'-3' exonuclease